MFTQRQLNTIDRNYFIVFEASPYQVIIKSKNTRHFWKIRSEDDKQKIIIYHSHQGDCNYHFHYSVGSLEKAIHEIKNHDIFQIKHRAKEDNDYDYIPLLPDSEYFIY